MADKVFVSGCFDLLHSGHVAFLKTAAMLGDLYVGVARDETIALLKGTTPCNTEAERLYMVKGIRYVKDAWVSSGLGLMDFAADVERLRPEIFIVNGEGDAPEKAALCARLGIAYRVLPRKPEPGLPARSTSALCHSREQRGEPVIPPYRAELCGAWLDQPFVNRIRPGYVICAQLEPHAAFKAGGLATSTRAQLVQLMAAGLTRTDPETLARLLFRQENGIDQPDHPVSGAQDALGLCVPGVSIQYYDGGYWPTQVESITDTETLRWLESHLSLYEVHPRLPGFDPLQQQNLRQIAAVEALARAAAMCRHAIKTRRQDELAESFSLCRKAQKQILPAMFPADIESEMERMEGEGRFRAWKFTGCGGGGWVLLVDAAGLPGAIPLKISLWENK